MAKIDLTQHPPFVYPDYRSSVLRGPNKRLLNLDDMCKKEPRVELSEISGSLANKFSTSKRDNNAYAQNPRRRLLYSKIITTR